jgi:hypothetical protein
MKAKPHANARTSARIRPASQRQVGMLQRAGQYIAIVTVTPAPTACGKSSKLNNYPISHWFNDGEDGTPTSPAVTRSALSFPNYAIQEESSRFASELPKRCITIVDMWLSDVSFMKRRSLAALIRTILHVAIAGCVDRSYKFVAFATASVLTTS